ncbi:uncharacterized protein LOC131675748 [Phymastichus coffea]|uniref:uncharacterized protein LOC131675748 n=1 Tax=Phymastichus coffea TaxID=108790 RepID=UPI00273B89F6|nr:uncharacterized protein LOC131675748 [Phymastichus coffea]XP_058810847.1 uncharacterized protein LOC131675748 [Phymastichus coffea]XP_058810848.1 uncharacterized protein LOC131675748 [Phymastichus coffea]
MKDQQTSATSSTTRDIVIECSSEPDLKKMTVHQDKTNNNDAGYMTSSNDSLQATAEILTIEVDNHNDEKWKLSIPPKLNSLSVEDTIRIIKDVSSEITRIPDERRREWLVEKFTEYYSSVMPKSLIELSASVFFDGDSGTSIDAKPDWLDIDKFRRGQKLASDQLFGMFYANLLSLFTMFCFEDGLRPLIFTNASSTPYTAFKRYLSTGTRIQNWYTSDPWTVGTPAYNDIRAVRRMHAVVRKNIRDTPLDEYVERTTLKDSWCPALSRTRRDMESTCPAPKPGQCPYMFHDHVPQLKERKLNQGEMAITQFAFVGIHVLNPKFFGMHDVTDEDLEAYCHLWRGLGYLLGIDDESNFCRGTLEDVRTRSRDFLEYWVKPNFRVVNPEWEHMMRCMVEGLQYYFPGSTYETCLLDLAEIINLHMPRTYNALSYSIWIRHNIVRFYFNHASKLPGVRAFLNRRLIAALEKARNFDEDKHQELKQRSAKTIDSYLKQAKAEESIENGISL